MALQKIISPQIIESIISEVVTKIVENFRPEKSYFGGHKFGANLKGGAISIFLLL
jgi:hypothetical protein